MRISRAFMRDNHRVHPWLVSEGNRDRRKMSHPGEQTTTHKIRRTT